MLHGPRGSGHVVGLYPASCPTYAAATSQWGELGGTGWELLHTDAESCRDHLEMTIREWNLRAGICKGFMGVAGRGVLTHTPEAVVVWEVRRYGGGSLSLACVVDGCRLFMSMVGGSLGLATGMSDECYLRMHTVCPPTVDLAPLSALYLLDDDDDGTSEFTDFEERVCTQSLMDAAQQTGYFFITGVVGLEAAAGRVIDLLKAGYEGSPARAEFTKTTLFTSTGKVKVSAVPELFEEVALPGWVPQEDAIEAYFTRAMRVGHVILEALLQREFEGDGRSSNVEGGSSATSADLFGMLRSVCYPAGMASATDFGPQHGSLEEHTDKTWITLLAASTLDGLEFSDTDGARATVRPLDSFAPHPAGPRVSLLVNIGDAMHTFTNGAFVSRPHRARNVAADGARVSLPLFIEPAPGQWPTAPPHQPLRGSTVYLL